MDDIVGFVAERIALQIRKSRELDAEQRRIAAAIAAPPTPAAARVTSGTIAPTPAPTAAVATPPIAARPSPAVRKTRINLDDAFPTTLDPVALPRPAHTNALLAAFSGGTSLLGAVVLAEALAAPVSLRGGPPHRP